MLIPLKFSFYAKSKSGDLHTRIIDIRGSLIPDDCPVLIGQVPLELLDFVVDPIAQSLVGNPEHDGEQMIDLF